MGNEKKQNLFIAWARQDYGISKKVRLLKPQYDSAQYLTL